MEEILLGVQVKLVEALNTLRKLEDNFHDYPELKGIEEQILNVDDRIGDFIKLMMYVYAITTGDRTEYFPNRDAHFYRYMEDCARFLRNGNTIKVSVVELDGKELYKVLTEKPFEAVSLNNFI